MATYQCKNFGACSKADAAEMFTLAAGADDKCPECGLTLTSVETVRAISSLIPLVGVRLAAAAAAAAVIMGGLAWQYHYKKYPFNGAPDASTGSPLVFPSPAEPVLAPEAAAVKRCDEATRTKHPDADLACQRAAAFALMNTGVRAAIAGQYTQAEKDYRAAKDKDPDFPELYYNLAVLKARQNRGREAIGYLVLAGDKGFAQFSVVKTEQALQALKSDPVLKVQLEAFEARR